MSKKKINFQVEYKDSKCNLIQTNFFEVILKDRQDDTNGKTIFGTIFFVAVTIILFIAKFLWYIFTKKK